MARYGGKHTIRYKWGVTLGSRMQTVFHADDSAGDREINLAHLFSSYNRKYLPQIDKKGNAQMFTVSIKALSTSACVSTFSTASNGYVTKRAVKAWHRIWRKQFTDMGYNMKELGPYGQNLRVDLTPSDDAFGSGTAEIGGGEWTRSDIISVPSRDPGDTGAIAANEISDLYFLHLTGSSVSSSTTDTHRWTSAGMIESWLGSRKRKVGSTDSGSDSGVDETYVVPDNPLVHARGDSFKSEDVADEVREYQGEEPPYAEASQALLMTQGKVHSDTGIIGSAVVNAPCGLLNVVNSATCGYVIELLAITDM